MMVIRTVAHHDVPALLRRAAKTGGGLTSLPEDEKNPRARVERPAPTWGGGLRPGARGQGCGREGAGGGGGGGG
ncbi:arginine N-succinyltransferase, partial [Cronobacter sakazakii]|uniref:arginine N-succinyltransferase n=1 Tax=Cronobacter sakazakii TaxID=28141 RepID=UPI0005189EAA